MSTNKIRQPIASIGALSLWKLSRAALCAVSNGDEADPYVYETRKIAERAAEIAYRCLKKKNIDPTEGK